MPKCKSPVRPMSVQRRSADGPTSVDTTVKRRRQDGTCKHVRLLFGGGPSLSEIRRGAEGAEQ